MAINFRPAVREQVGLWMNLIGGSGSGKTFSAMEIASGIAGDKPFALIDTENRRGLHYADMFNFHHADLRAPFRPDAYAEAVIAADAAGYPVIVIDSGSHVWAGEGGVLDWQDEEVTRMAGDDWKKRESVKMAAWIKPKMSHKKMVQKLLQVKAHIILCLRAEEKVEMIRENGKTVIRAKQSLTGLDGWIPVCDKNLPFEATCSFLLTADKPGIPHPIKLQEQHKALFPLDKPINRESGKRLAEWAAGGVTKSAPVEKSLAERRSEMVRHFAEMGVEPDAICRAVQVDHVHAIGADEMAILKSHAKAIRDGANASDVFPVVPTPETQPNGQDSPESAPSGDNSDADLEGLRSSLAALVDSVTVEKLSPGQKARFENRENLTLEQLQNLYSEVEKKA